MVDEFAEPKKDEIRKANDQKKELRRKLHNFPQVLVKKTMIIESKIPTAERLLKCLARL